MKITIPNNIKKYIEDQKTVPLVRIKGVLWYSITEGEKASLRMLISELNAISCLDWNSLLESEKWELSCMLNDAERILKNSITRTN